MKKLFVLSLILAPGLAFAANTTHHNRKNVCFFPSMFGMRHHPIHKEKDLSIMHPSDLFISAIRGDLKALQRFIANNPSIVNATNPYGSPALYLAVRQRSRPDVIKMLIANGADVNATEGIAGETVLQQAIANNDYDTVKLLLAAGADTNIRRKFDGKTALAVAVEYGHTRVILLLCAIGNSST